MIAALIVPDGDYLFEIREGSPLGAELAGIQFPVADRRIGAKILWDSKATGHILRIREGIWLILDRGGNPVMSGAVQRPAGHLHLAQNGMVLCEIGLFGLGQLHDGTAIVLSAFLTDAQKQEIQKQQDEIWKKMKTG